MQLSNVDDRKPQRRAAIYRSSAEQRYGSVRRVGIGSDGLVPGTANRPSTNHRHVGRPTGPAAVAKSVYFAPNLGDFFSSAATVRQCDSNNRKQRKYVCITTSQPYTKSDPNPNPNLNPNPATKQHAIVSIQQYLVICPIRMDGGIHPFQNLRWGNGYITIPQIRMVNWT